jgi:predicted nucleic acid-binding protein
MRSFFDTNVLVYFMDAGEPEKQAIARDLLAREIIAKRAVFSTQVLQEFYVSVTSRLTPPLSPATAANAIQDFAVNHIVQIHVELILNAIARSQLNWLSFWDSLIVEAAIEAGAERLYTEDLQHGQVIEGLTILNPFAM